MQLFIGADHGGFELKQKLLKFLETFSSDNKSYDKAVVEKFKNLKIKDFGCFDSQSVNYPDYAEKVCTALLESNFGLSHDSTTNYSNTKPTAASAVNDAHKSTTDSLNFPSMGLLICGSGQGMAMKANKYNHIRAALVWNEELTRLSREHNNANVLCLPGRLISEETAVNSLILFLTTPFAQGRHSSRVEKINNC